MNTAADKHEAAEQPPMGVRTERLNRGTQGIPAPGAFSTALPLDGYQVPDPDDTKAHLEMADELAREVIEQAKIPEHAKERLKELDLECYQARSLRRGWSGTREERGKRMLREVGRVPRDEPEIVVDRREAKELVAATVGKKQAAAEKLRRYHGEVLPMCAVIGAALTITGDGAVLADGSSSRSSITAATR